MTKNQFENIVEQWLADPENEERINQLEKKFGEDYESLASFKKLRADFPNLSRSEPIAENPFFFSKLKSRMENNRTENVHVQRIRWATYVATLSLSIVAGVLLGNQVESTSSANTEEDIFAEELLVDDYSIDNLLLLDIEE